ncbi:hypothetical protein, partial [Bradyrhizobium brasilense]|uniref:hypothetical protein n=1 Tax=Bradyrhizobium brasilense TaxID=1419277 RepID=UPI001E310D60
HLFQQPAGGVYPSSAPIAPLTISQKSLPTCQPLVHSDPRTAVRTPTWPQRRLDQQHKLGIKKIGSAMHAQPTEINIPIMSTSSIKLFLARRDQQP